MRRQKLPTTDSIEELASFWDTHDLTEFEGELEEATDPVFVRAKGTSLSIALEPSAAQHLRKIARSKGLRETTVLRRWILERLQESSRLGQPPKKAFRTTPRKARRG